LLRYNYVIKCTDLFFLIAMPIYISVLNIAEPLSYQRVMFDCFDWGFYVISRIATLKSSLTYVFWFQAVRICTVHTTLRVLRCLWVATISDLLKCWYWNTKYLNRITIWGKSKLVFLKIYLKKIHLNDILFYLHFCRFSLLSYTLLFKKS
jgi:hypothetical protein